MDCRKFRTATLRAKKNNKKAKSRIRKRMEVDLQAVTLDLAVRDRSIQEGSLFH